MTNIVFIHMGESWYLDTVLNVAKNFNPNANVILLGDLSNRQDSMDTTEVLKWNQSFLKNRDKTKTLWAHHTSFGHWEYPDKYYDIITNYKHIGTEAGKRMWWKHQFCFSRWYLLHDLMELMGDVWYFDSDTLICRKLSEVQDWYDKNAWIINRISGCATYFKTNELLKKLCEMIYDLRHDETYMNTKKQALELLATKGKNWNFCDMSIIAEWSKTYIVGDLATIIHDSVFDPNINCSKADQWPNCPYEFEMVECKNRPIKKIYFLRHRNDGQNYPYFKLLKKDDGMEVFSNMVRANTLNMSWFDNRKNYFWEMISNLRGDK